jgi:hypothetical protein
MLRQVAADFKWQVLSCASHWTGQRIAPQKEDRMPALNHTELNQRYHNFLASGMDESSMEEAQGLFEQFWGKSREALSTAALQRALWKRSKVFFLGYGENVDCEPLVQDAQVVELLAGLPHRDWSPDPQGRAQQVQDAYDSLLALAAPL